MQVGHFRLDGKVALVTGASGTIGREIAVALAEAGADIVAVGRDGTRLNETANKVAEHERRILLVEADLSRSEDIRMIASRCVEEFSGCDILVNNAATNVWKLVDQTTEKDFDYVFSTNLKGPYFLTQLLSEKMKTNSWGSIIFITSLLGNTAMKFTSLYGSTKAALMQLARSLSLEWAKYNIRVNSVSPGSWSGGMLAPVVENAAYKEALINMTPARRLGEYGDIGGVAVFLASEASRFITGQNIVVDGGFSTSRIL